MAGFMCDIVTPVAKLVSDEVELVVVPGVEGEMGFLKGHAPLVSVLADGEARVKAVGASETVHYALQGGYVEVTDDKVIILADRALPAADIDVEQVREQLTVIEEQLSGLSEEEARKTTLAADKAWCDVQLRVAKAASVAWQRNGRCAAVDEQDEEEPPHGALPFFRLCFRGVGVPKRDGLAQCERFGFESGMIRGKSLCADGLRRKDEGERS